MPTLAPTALLLLLSPVRNRVVSREVQLYKSYFPMLSIQYQKTPFNVKPSTKYLELGAVANCWRKSTLHLLSMKHGQETSWYQHVQDLQTGFILLELGAIQRTNSGWPLAECMSMLSYCTRSFQGLQGVSLILCGFASANLGACKLHSGFGFRVFLIFICITSLNDNA